MSALIEIQRPPLNFFDISLINQIADALEEFDNDIEIRALGAGGARQGVLRRRQFQRSGAAGAGSARGQGKPTRSSTVSARSTSLYVQAVRIFRNKKPIVAAVHGAAIGGGLGLAVSADFRVTCPEARFAANFTKLGFHPGFGLTTTLPELVGKNNAELIFYTSRRVTGEEATRMGLANVCVPQDQVRAEAMKLAARDRRMLAARPALDPRHHARRPRRARAGRHQPRTRRTVAAARHRGFQGRRQGHRRTPGGEFQGAVTFLPSPLEGRTSSRTKVRHRMTRVFSV